jgi:hypothetical protein
MMPFIVLDRQKFEIKNKGMNKLIDNTSKIIKYNNMQYRNLKQIKHDVLQDKEKKEKKGENFDRRGKKRHRLASRLDTSPR